MHARERVAGAGRRDEHQEENAAIVGEDAPAALAIVAIDNEAAALAAVARLKERGVLVNAVDRPEHCDFTLPAIVDRAPVLVAIGTGGVSAGLAAALRQRLEQLLPATLGRLADALYSAREAIRDEWPDPAERRRSLARALAPGGDLDPLAPDPDVDGWLGADELREARPYETVALRLTSADPDDLTLRQARALANADRVVHGPGVPRAILDRARADAARVSAADDRGGAGLTVHVTFAGEG